MSRSRHNHDTWFVISEHINNMVFKAHQRANAILRCFVSHNITLLLRAYLVYVRPLLEYTVCPKKVSPLTFCNNDRKSAPI